MRSRGGRRSRRLTPRRLARAAIAALALAYAGWWVVRTNVVAAAGHNPFIGVRVAPSDPRVRIDLAMFSFYAHGGAVPPDEQRGALDALRSAPLSDEPFLLAGVDALAHGRDAEGERLLIEARRRNPRLRMARLLLLNQYLKEGRVPEASVEIGAIDRLVTQAGNVFVPYLSQMVQDPKAGPQLVPLLRREPGLRDQVLLAMAKSRADPARIMAVAGDSIRPRATPPEWQAALLDGFVKQQRYADALALWRKLAGQPPQGAEKGIYDAAFHGLPGPPPFNWALAEGGAGVAEHASGGGLSIDYYGRDDGDLASQLLMLRPGRYRLAFRAEGDAQGSSSRMVWSVSCGESALVQVPVTGVVSAPHAFAASFTVPAGCPVQWLKLRGVSGDMETGQAARFSALSIEPEAGK